jgi:class 3 adenylate cyclase/tetratricopeptide (TPR) repeat protein
VDTPPPTAERKVISALFADLVGFTAASEQADPEDVGARLAAYHRAVRQEVERYGGRVEKLIGDGVFAVFGAPTAHEDDPERAVRSALRIQDSIDRLNEQRPELELEVRVAVTTGEAVVRLDAAGDQEGVVGDVVNTASRLQQLAPPGGILVDERTYLATRSIIEYEARAPVTVKGKLGELPIWRALDARSRYGVGVEIEAGTPFIGRRRDLRLLMDTFERVLGESSVQLVTISGEPGVGKSRLVTEFQQSLDGRPELVWWRQGRCLPYGEGVSFWALGEIVKAQAGILETESTAEADAKLVAALGNLVDDSRDREWLRARLSPLVGGTAAPSGADRAEVFSAWLRFFEALAAANPLVMVFEDLHWADPSLIEFIDYLVDRSVDAPILVLCVTRPDLFGAYPQWGGGKRNAGSIALSPLSPDETGELVASLGAADLGEDRVGMLIERSGGNPLYATEFVRMLQDRGAANVDGEVPLPDTVQALIAARLDLLPVEEKSLLQASAVVGKMFWVGALSFVTQQDPGAVTDLLVKLTRKELVRPVRRSSMKGQAEYGFWHGLVQDVAYGQLPRETRLRTHVAVARWMEAASGDRLGDAAELLAHHYTEALELARRLDEEDEELTEQTRRFLVMAGDRVVDLDAAKAVSYYRRALDLSPPAAEAARVLTKLGRIEGLSGELEAGETDLTAAVLRAREAGDPALEALATSELAAAMWLRGDADRVDEYDRGARELLSRVEPGPVSAKVLAYSAAHTWLRGFHDEAIELAREAVAAARRWDPGESLIRALFALGGSRLYLGDRAGLDDQWEALELSLEKGLSRMAIVGYNNVATYLLVLEGPDGAVRMMEEAVAMAAERGLEVQRGWSRMTLIESLYQTDSWDRLRAELAELLDEYSGQETQVAIGAASWTARVAFDSDDTEGAAHYGERFLDGARSIQDAQFLVPALAFMSLVEFERGALDTAEAHVTEFEKVTEASPQFRALNLPSVAEALVGLGDPDRLESLMEGIEPVSPVAEHCLGWSRAILLEGRGEPEEGAATYQVAAAGLSGLHTLLEAYTSLGAGRCLAALGRHDEAKDWLDRARRRAGGLGAQRVIRLVEEVGAG